MKIQPNLIPRFNMDYNLNDLFQILKSNRNNDLYTLKALFKKENFFFTNNGRSSLYVILRSLNLPEGSKIGVPLYSCTVVFDAIIKAGYIPHFIDIDLSNYTLDPKDLENKIEDISALLVIHTFGRPADMDEIKKKVKDLPIIEDCAHSLLSEYKGKKTGTIGLASFFSLAKYISAGGGGMIILNDKKHEDDITRELSLLSTPTRLSEFNHSIFIYIYSFLYHKPWFGGFAYHIGSIFENTIDLANKKSFKATKANKNDLYIFLLKLKSFKENVELQRKNSQILLNELHSRNFILPYERKDTKCNFFLFPILFSDKVKRDNACEFLKKNGVDTAKLYSLTPAIARKFYGYKNDCPNTEIVADRVLTIPNYYSLNSKELLKIINTVNRCGENI